MVWKRNSESDEEADVAEVGFLNMTGVASAEDR